MLFTDGKDREYEKMMLEKPRTLPKDWKPNERKTYNDGYQYKYEDLNCRCCADFKKKSCPHALCPNIIENLDDLSCDGSFLSAVSNADNCKTPHQNTLITLKARLANTTTEGVQ